LAQYQRDEYNAIIYLQPMNNRNQVAIGFDMFTEAVRRQRGPPAIQGRRLLQDA
jgi:CHASE1-domain containing sensor protein